MNVDTLQAIEPYYTFPLHGTLILLFALSILKFFNTSVWEENYLDIVLKP